ncbi:hypothetical protein A6R68_13332, partial [Neotoma lepida]
MSRARRNAHISLFTTDELLEVYLNFNPDTENGRTDDNDKFIQAAKPRWDIPSAQDFTVHWKLAQEKEWEQEKNTANAKETGKQRRKEEKQNSQ